MGHLSWCIFSLGSGLYPPLIGILRNCLCFRHNCGSHLNSLRYKNWNSWWVPTKHPPPPHYLQILDTLTEASVGSGGVENLFLCLCCFSVAFAQNSPYAKVTHVGAACSDTFDCWMRASLPFKLASLFLIMKDNFEFSGVCCRHYADMM